MSEFYVPNVVVLHDGTRDPARIAMMAGLESPLSIYGFTARGSEASEHNVNIGSIAARADHFIFDRQFGDCRNKDLENAIIHLGIMSHTRVYYVFEGEEVLDAWSVPPGVESDSIGSHKVKGSIIDKEAFWGVDFFDESEMNSIPRMEP